MTKTTLTLLILIALCCFGCSKSAEESTSAIESRLQSVESELLGLSRLSLYGGVGPIGYRSMSFIDPDHPFWVEIDLGEEKIIDQIVFVPVLARPLGEGFRADAWPDAFSIIAGSAGDKEGRVIAQYQSDQRAIPGISPIPISFQKTSASWVRIEIPCLYARAFDGRFLFQLAEVLIFSGEKNVALRRPVRTAFMEMGHSIAWAGRYLVDGVTPYLMDSERGEGTLAYLSGRNHSPYLTIDLGEPHSFSEIHLHAVDQSDTAPQSYAGDLGIPHHFIIEGANQADFSDAFEVLNFRRKDIYDTGPIMMWNIDEITCRYIKLTPIETEASKRDPRVGFAEIGLISNGENVALGTHAFIGTKEGGTEHQVITRRPPPALVDGRNMHGEILPVRQWLNELARRYELETEQASLSALLNQRYLQQKRLLAWMSSIMILLFATIVFVIFLSRMLRVRNETIVRERIAANLHDELGANLHAIGLLGDVAEESLAKPERLKETVQRIRGLTERTIAAARTCANMLNERGICEDLVEEIKQDANRLLADVEYRISFEGEDQLNAMKLRRRIDIFLFYKECVTNIIRHARATEVIIDVTASPDRVMLTVTDNGCGLEGGPPPSLTRRARLMGGRASIEHLTIGTTIRLELKRRKFSWGNF